jgi:hypothetical protein
MDNLRLARKGGQGGVRTQEGRSLRPLERQACWRPGESPRAGSLEGPVHIEVNLVTHHVVAGLSHLVGNGLLGDDHAGLGQLALIG